MNQPSLSHSGCQIFFNTASKRCLSPTVTVLISLYNYSAYIEGCLESVRASKTEHLPGGFDVVIVDDGSTDASVEVVRKYMDRCDLPICLIVKLANSGVADTRNLGLQAARAPFVFILDADNEIRPDCLAKHHQAIASSKCAMVYGMINQFDSTTRKSILTMSHTEWSVRELVSRPYIDAMAMVRKDAALQVGGYSPEYGTLLPQGWEDYDLWLKLAQAGHSGKLIPEILSDYRVHQQSLLHKTLPFKRELATYFSRKFHALVQTQPDLPVLFGLPRNELAMINGQGAWTKPETKIKPFKLVRHLLGEKTCRSLSKRFAEICRRLYP